MTSTNGAATPPAVPGDRPPAGRLTRPPSDRYAAGAKAGSGAGAGTGTAPARSALRALAPAIVVGVITALALVLVGGVLAERRGLLAIAGIGGAVMGLLGANAAVSRDGLAPPPMSRREATRMAVGLALLAVAAGALGTWAYGRLEGGAMDPLSYLLATLGLYVPAQAVVAGLAAAWGVGAGPVRGRV